MKCGSEVAADPRAQRITVDVLAGRGLSGQQAGQRLAGGDFPGLPQPGDK